MHDVWVLAYGEQGAEWAPGAANSYDLTQATCRNTFAVYPGSWTAVRVKFDNAGIALFRTSDFYTIQPQSIIALPFIDMLY